MSNSRLEKFIYAICGMDIDDLPTPLSRIETLWDCLITGETPDFEPLSRNEKYLMSMLTGDVDALPEPTSRSEKLLYKIATGETDLTDVPGYLSRYEELLKHLIENGGIGGTDFEYVLYTLNQPLSTLYTTAEGPVKSAILKGQTLVNLLKFDELDSKTNKVGDTITVTNGTDTSAWYGGRIYLTKSIERNKKYIAMWDNLEWTHTHVNGKMGVIQVLTKNASTNRDLKIEQTGNDDRNYMIFSCTDENADLSKVQIAVLATSWATGEVNNLTTIKGLKVLEYQDGMENWDIPYFEGMQSVKMPVLTTANRINVFIENKEFSRGFYNGINGVKASHDYMDGYICDVEPNTTYSLYFKDGEPDTNKIAHVSFWNENTYISGWTTNPITFTTPANCNKLRFAYDRRATNINPLFIPSNIVLSIGTGVVYDESFKSNTLSCNEEVTLRGIGDVKDTLDGNTGE